MKSVLIAPRKYVQGRGVLTELGDYLKPLGRKPSFCGRVRQEDRWRHRLRQPCCGGIEMVDVLFEGEATGDERGVSARSPRERGADFPSALRR